MIELDRAASRDALRQTVATLAYRAAKVLRDVPPAFADYSAGPDTRKPLLILAHMGDLMAWGTRMARGESVWKAEGGDDWDREHARFFDGLAALDAALADDAAFTGDVKQLIQGPLADAFTHVGQLALLRGMAGCPVRPESYARADIVAGRVGTDQAPPGREFTGDASVPRTR